MNPVVFHPKASLEVIEAVQYYESQSPGLGIALVTEIEATVRQMKANPMGYQKIGRRVRRKSLWRFPYHVIYAQDPDRIRIVAFAHQKRRPYYWKNRLLEGL